MLVGQAHSFTQQARLAITLAWVAGYTNILTILTCGTVTSHVSGTVSQWGYDLVAGRWGLAGLTSFLLAMFIAGAMLSAVCTETGRRRGWESIYVLPMVIEAVLLSAFAVGVEMHDHLRIESGVMLYAMTGLASLAMGLQNATITRISGGVVRTTHMTGVFTDLGLESVQFAYWLADRGRHSPPLPARALAHSAQSHSSGKRLAMLLSVVGSFAIGAGLGAAAYGKFPHWAMYPPVVFLLWVVVQDLRRPICEIEAFGAAGGGVGSGSAVDLPEALAVYHLRKDKDRRGAVHRLPNLLAWSERLPSTTRVVILDLDQATRLDENAALELRQLVQRLKSTGRRLVVAGVDAARFRAIMRAGAGDVLDQRNVCPDLELAIARGFTLLDGAAA